MSTRKTPLVTGEIYHLYNRSIAQEPILTSIRDNNFFIDLLEYYRFWNADLRYSHFSRLSKDENIKRLDWLYKENKTRLDLYAFSTMPNHFHLLVKQNTDGGLSNFMRYVQDSYAKYFNKKYVRSGGLFLAPFKAVRIEKENQFLHVMRYIHLNPLTSYVLKNETELTNYPWNSYSDYISKSPRRFIETTKIQSLFKNKNLLKAFILDQLSYQRELNKIKHLLFE